ncbi:MAG TPA: hypothetical protein VFS43_07225 [Polyangiaceae bacterium]|nr:hypothetical protein [Polyangiaceae bacterium]
MQRLELFSRHERALHQQRHTMGRERVAVGQQPGVFFALEGQGAPRAFTTRSEPRKGASEVVDAPSAPFERFTEGADGLSEPFAGLPESVDDAGAPFEAFFRGVDALGRPFDLFLRVVDDLGGPFERLGQGVDALGEPFERFLRGVGALGASFERSAGFGVGEPNG